MGAKKGKAELAVPVKKKEGKCVLAFQAHSKKNSPAAALGAWVGSRGLKGTALPYNNRIEPTAGGCHGARLREPRASSLRALLLRRRALRPSSRFIRTLYGR